MNSKVGFRKTLNPHLQCQCLQRDQRLLCVLQPGFAEVHVAPVRFLQHHNTASCTI